MTKKNNTKIYKEQIKDPNTSNMHKLYLITHFKRLKRIRLTQIILIVAFVLLWEFATFLICWIHSYLVALLEL